MAVRFPFLLLLIDDLLLIMQPVNEGGFFFCWLFFGQRFLSFLLVGFLWCDAVLYEVQFRQIRLDRIQLRAQGLPFR